MKTLFVHATIKEKVSIPQDVIAQLPLNLGVFTTIQYLKQMPAVKRQLEEAGKIVKIVGQTLGCRAEGAQKVTVDAFFYIGSGEFHPLLVSYENPKLVYCYNPSLNTFSTISQEDIDRHLKKKKANLVKFLHAQNVGILITTKVGQSDNKINTYSEEIKMRGALELMKRGDKNYYIFAFDTLELYRLEDFPFIECWLNTACSRIADEKTSMVNLDDVREYYAQIEGKSEEKLVSLK